MNINETKTMNNLDKQYTDLLQDILKNGVYKDDRTGTGTLSVFGRQIRHKMSDGFPLLTTKKLNWNSIVTELIWFLRGDTNIKFLVDHKCNIWNGDTYKNYANNINDSKWMSKVSDEELSTYGESVDGLSYKPYTKKEFVEKIKTDEEFANKWGELGPIYGAQWRRCKSKNVYGEGKLIAGINEVGEYVETYRGTFHTKFIDQIENLVRQLRENPDSRRMVVDAWNVSDMNDMVLPPCHNFFQCYTRDLNDAELRVRYPDFRQINDMKNEFLAMGNYEIAGHYKDLEMIEKQKISKKAISLMWNQRSADTFLGLPFNIACYGLLLEILAKELDMIPDELIGNLGDTHLYLNHIDQAHEQLPREPFELPRVTIHDNWKFRSASPIFADTIDFKDIVLDHYKSHPPIKAPLSN